MSDTTPRTEEDLRDRIRTSVYRALAEGPEAANVLDPIADAALAELRPELARLRTAERERDIADKQVTFWKEHLSRRIDRLKEARDQARAELADLREATTPPDGEDRRLVEDALHCAETGQAEHWPTVAAYLRGEVLWLRTELARLRAAADPRAAKHDPRADRYAAEEAHGVGYDDGYGHGYAAAIADRRPAEEVDG